ncbi:hypothetical protein [Bordetella sp. FB-8]|uniref:hypothetical protein n=1 Tax=Bordetella sp. FB-8 TaxID=1159870 RepID=UPI00039B9F33|nr:hypothetical protein [Bordetella sp. FB-8]
MSNIAISFLTACSLIEDANDDFSENKISSWFEASTRHGRDAMVGSTDPDQIAPAARHRLSVGLRDLADFQGDLLK